MNFLDCIGVKKHAREDEKRVGEGLYPISVVRCYVTVPTGTQSCGDEVEASYVLHLELILRYVLHEHPALLVVSVCADHYLAASQEVYDYTCLDGKGKDFQPLFDVLFFKDGPVFAIEINKAAYCCVYLEKTVKSRKF